MDAMLNGDQIKEKQLIQNGKPESYRAASYDLTVGRIIAPGQEQLIDQPRFIIPPQGMVEVISAERVKLPPNIAGYTTLKNGLSNQGVLAISIGIIDPLYEGLMSSTLINFSKSPLELRTGDPFLRVTFHEYHPKANLKAPPLTTDQLYVRDRKRKVKTQFSNTFLDLATHVSELSSRIFDDAFRRWRTSLFVWVPLAAFALALLTFFMNAATAYTNRWAVNREQIKAELRKEMQQEDYSHVRQQLDDLQRQVQQMKRDQSPTATETSTKSTKHSVAERK